MGRQKNLFQKQSSLLIALVLSISAIADTSLDSSINKNQDTFQEVALKIWDFAEVGYQEYKSSQLLQSELAAHGFKITTGIADIPTAFIAEYSNGGPVIGILGEYDALPGLMQTTSPFKEERDDVIAGHACGHHMFGAASAWAAVAVKDWLVKTKTPGTIRFYGTPAEEGGSGKSIWLERAYLMMWMLSCIGTPVAVMVRMLNHQILINLQNLDSRVFLLMQQAHLTKGDLR